MNDFIKWLNTFMKRPILPEQEAEIVCAMIDGRLNKEGAKKTFQYVVEQNIKAHNELMSMSTDELIELVENYDQKTCKL